MGMSMMIHARVTSHLWPYAFRHAVYLMNRLPTSSLGYDTTSFIQLFGYAPDEKHRRIFGCDAYALILDGQKHEPRANKGIYVGQSDDSTGHLFYNPSSQAISETNHIKFNEDMSTAKQCSQENEDGLLQEIDHHQHHQRQYESEEDSGSTQLKGKQILYQTKKKIK